MNYFVSLLLIVLVIGSFDDADANHHPIKVERGYEYHLNVPSSCEKSDTYSFSSKHPMRIVCKSFHLKKSTRCTKEHFHIEDNDGFSKRICGNKFKKFTTKAEKLTIKYYRKKTYSSKPFSCWVETASKCKNNKECKNDKEYKNNKECKNDKECENKKKTKNNKKKNSNKENEHWICKNWPFCISEQK